MKFKLIKKTTAFVLLGLAPSICPLPVNSRYSGQAQVGRYGNKASYLAIEPPIRFQC